MQQPPNPYPQYSQQQWQQPPMPPQQQWNPQQPPFLPQQYQQPPQYQPPKKKSRKGLFIVLGVILAVALIGCIGVAALVNAGGQAAQQAVNQTSTQVAQLPTTQPTTQPTQPATSGKWTTVQTFTGNGNKKTSIFTVPGDWKIVWSCKGLTDGTGVDGVIYITVYGSDNSPIDANAVSGTCTY